MTKYQGRMMGSKGSASPPGMKGHVGRTKRLFVLNLDVVKKHDRTYFA